MVIAPLRRKSILRFSALQVLLASAVMIGVPAASAQVNSPSVNTCFNTSGIPCYARGYFHDGTAKGGAYVQTAVTRTTASGNSWLNETLWVTTNNGESYWAEIGYSDNNPLCRGTRSWYITYYNPDKLVQHCISGSVTVGDYYSLEIQEIDSNDYGIYLNNGLVATDHGATGWSYYAFTGAEYHLTTVNTNGKAYFRYHQLRNPTCCVWYYWPSGHSDVTYPTVINWNWTTDWTHGNDSGSD